MFKGTLEKPAVLVLTDSFPPCPYAASQRIGAFAEIISSSGFETIILTLFRCLGTKFKSRRYGACSIYNVRYPASLLRLSVVMVNPLLVLLFLFGGAIVALSRQLGAVLVSVPQGEVVISGFFLSKMFGVPLVVDLRDWYPVPSVELLSHKIPRPRLLNELLILLFKAIYRRSQKVVCVDVNIQRNVLASGVTPDKVLVIPNGADTSTYRPSSLEERRKIRLNHGLPNEKTIFVYAGSLAKHYPVIDVIKGAKILSDKRDDFQLLIISFSNYLAYAEYVKRLGLEEFVRFLGPLPVAETAKLMSACDVGVVTYGKEIIWQGTYGSKIFAYLSCGLPIVASGPSSSVIEELIQEYQLGYFVGHPEPSRFAKGFLNFLDKDSGLAEMGKRAARVVKHHFDRNVLGHKLVDSLKAE